MSRIRMTMLGALVAIVAMAVSGIAATGASANFVLSETKCEGGAITAFCWSATEKAASGLLELTGEEAFTGVVKPGTKVILKGKLGEEAIEITCEAANAVGTIAQPEPLVKSYTGTGKITYKGCVLAGALGKKCKVPAEKATNELVGAAKAGGGVVFTPKTGKVFIEIPIEEKEKCPATVKGTKLVEGTQVCNWVSPKEDLKLHELVCVEKSELLFAEQLAELTDTENVTLNNIGTDFWAVEDIA